MIIKQWHLYIADLEPRIGTKPGKQRPCLAIQPNELRGLGSTVILPITSKLTNDAFPLRVRLTKIESELDRDSDIMIDQILAWDNQLFVKELGKLPEQHIEIIKLALLEFFGLRNH